MFFLKVDKRYSFRWKVYSFCLQVVSKYSFRQKFVFMIETFSDGKSLNFVIFMTFRISNATVWHQNDF